MNSFLRYTALIEAFTGLALILLPVPLITVLFGSPLTGNNSIVLGMIAGIAILSIAYLCWNFKAEVNVSILVKGLILYNLIISLILLYGIFVYGLKGPAVWLVILFHLFQTVMSIVLLRSKKRTNPDVHLKNV